MLVFRSRGRCCDGNDLSRVLTFSRPDASLILITALTCYCVYLFRDRKHYCTLEHLKRSGTERLIGLHFCKSCSRHFQLPFDLPHAHNLERYCCFQCPCRTCVKLCHSRRIGSLKTFMRIRCRQKKEKEKAAKVAMAAENASLHAQLKEDRLEAFKVPPPPRRRPEQLRNRTPRQCKTWQLHRLRQRLPLKRGCRFSPRVAKWLPASLLLRCSILCN